MKVSLLKLVLNTVVIFLAVIFRNVYAADVDQNITNENYLFIQSAQSAKIEEAGKPSHYKITLYHVEPWTLYFSDRPKRDMGIMPLEDFLKKMKEQGNKYKPKGLNSAIVSIAEDQHDHISMPLSHKFVFTIANPNYDKKHSQLTYDASLVPNEKTGAVDVFPKQILLKRVELFIDACIGCVGP